MVLVRHQNDAHCTASPDALRCSVFMSCGERLVAISVVRGGGLTLVSHLSAAIRAALTREVEVIYKSCKTAARSLPVSDWLLPLPDFPSKHFFFFGNKLNIW